MQAQLADELFEPRPASAVRAGMVVKVACTDRELAGFFALRHRVFSGTFGAMLPGGDGLDQEPVDDFCQHLIVVDEASGEVVAGTRILTDTQALVAGGFYTAGEFELNGLDRPGSRVMEIGRTCVDPRVRQSGAIGLLWYGLMEFSDIHRIRRIIGCASVPVGDSPGAIWPLYRRLLADGQVDAGRVRPRCPVPADTGDRPARLPALLKAYLRLGARVVGEPCWDPVFRVADLPMLLEPARLRGDYLARFLSQRRTN